jgi:hypothetical protein
MIIEFDKKNNLIENFAQNFFNTQNKVSSSIKR